MTNFAAPLVPHWVLAVLMQGQLRSDLVAEAETPPLPWELTRLGARAAWRAKQMAENSDALQGPVIFGAKRIVSSWLSWSMLKFSKFEDVLVILTSVCMKVMNKNGARIVMLKIYFSMTSQ